jgi:hypothetical protein
MSTKNKLNTVKDICLDLEAPLKDYLKASPKSHLSNVVRTIGALPIGYSLGKACISRLLSEPKATFGSLVGEISREVDLEYRTWEHRENHIAQHFKRPKGEPLWSSIKRLRATTSGIEHEKLIGISMVLAEIFLRRYSGVLLQVEYQWNISKQSRWISLYPHVAKAINEADPPELMVELLDNPEEPQALPSKGGTTPRVKLQDYPIAFNRYSVSPALKGELLKLTKGEPNGLYPDVQLTAPAPGYTKKEYGHYLRLEAQRLSGELQHKAGARALLRHQGDTFSFPLGEDFRGRIYMSGPGSPQNCKGIRKFLTDPQGRSLEYLDMKQSCITLLSLLTTGKTPEVDRYQQVATTLTPEWSSLLQDTFGSPTRDLMKRWYKALWFGQHPISGYNLAMRETVRYSDNYRDTIREEVKRIYLRGWELMEKDLQLPLEFHEETPQLVNPDGTVVTLSYLKTKAKRRISRFYGVHAKPKDDYVYMTTTETTSELDLRRTNRGLTANIIHALDSYILREQIRRITEELGEITLVPIHDCIGYPSEVREDIQRILPEVVQGCIPKFTEALQGTFSDLEVQPMDIPTIPIDNLYTRNLD